MSVPYAEVIGDPVAQSKSPAIHRFWLDRAGIGADYRATTVALDQLERHLLDRRADPDWRGCNVTMPHKLAVIPLLDRLDTAVERIGAVNTIVRGSDGGLTGYNTDAAGFLEPLRPELARSHLFRTARVFGTGGAARAAVSALARQGFTLVLVGRDVAKPRVLLDELVAGGDHHAVALSHFADATDFAFDDREGVLDLVVNTTPLGMTGQPALPLHFSHVPPKSIVYDIVTDPLDTPLLIAARNAGFATIDGLAMLIGQAAVAFELFFGQPPPREADGALRASLR